MNITIEQKKQKALELMKKLDIYKPYIKGFEKDNEVCFFEGFGGFWAYQEPELMEKIKTFEKEHNCLVYAVTHEYLEFGECYDFLYIPDYKEDWDFVLEHQGNMYFALAYIEKQFRLAIGLFTSTISFNSYRRFPFSIEQYIQ